MCGIAGIIKIHDPNDGPPPPPLDAIPEAWLDILDESIKHRGPDGQGRFRDRTTRPDGTIVDIALVHRRLSIIDHAGGHQPMVHDGDRLRPDLTYQPGETPIIASEIEPNKPIVAVVFNGCIYNHRELRAELEAAGHVFETDHSDTEVLVHGWREWGAFLPEHLDSMDVFAVWSRTQGGILQSRDRAGQKPLSYASAQSLSTTLFSSAYSGLVQLNAHIGESLDFEPTHLPLWIKYGWSRLLPLTQTAESLPWVAHASWITSHEGLPEDPCYDGGLPKRGFAEPLSHTQIDDAISESVTQCLASDVPLGCFLSGGVDSSLIAAHAMKHQGHLDTFCVRMPDERLDESKYAIEVAQLIGSNHTTLDIVQQPATDLVLLIEQLGLPLGDSSILPTYWVCKAAREQVTVALSGDGGDELFGGYNRYKAANWIQKFRPLLKSIPPDLPARSERSRFTMLRRLGNAARWSGYNELLSIFEHPDTKRLLPQNQVGHVLAHLREPEGFFETKIDPLMRDFLHYLPSDLLRKVDTASMSVGLEVRSPFLSKKLISIGLQTPLDILMPNGQRKGLLKQVARKYLPDHIVDRPKQGFAIPIGEWFRTDYGQMRQLLYDHLESTDPFPGLADAGVEINMKFVHQMLREHDAAGEKSINPWHGRDHSQRLYMLLVLSIWSKWLERTRSAP
jgi:asparagine synthase (glutamine-hydrolysing)